MTDLTKAELDANIQHMIQLNDTGLPDGAVVEYYDSCDDTWKVSLTQDRLASPSCSIYRITLPKPAPHPMLLSIVEHGCFPQDWAEWFTIERDGVMRCFNPKPSDHHRSQWTLADYTLGSNEYLGSLHLIYDDYHGDTTWKQQCWTLQELRDIIKQNTAQQGSITRNTVELSEADLYCARWYNCGKISPVEESQETIYATLFKIGERIETQRKEAQS